MTGLMMVGQQLFDRDDVTILLTYVLVFLINLLYEIISMGGVAALTVIVFVDALIRAVFITLVLFAGDRGIKWKQDSDR